MAHAWLLQDGAGIGTASITVQLCMGETQLLRLTWLSQSRPVNMLGCATDSQPRKGDLWKWKLFMPVIIHLLYTYMLLFLFLNIFVRFLYVRLWLVYNVLL